MYFSDGAGRTGTYIAISNLLERMKIEQTMDVFQSIKIIRGIRPQFVENAVSTSIITSLHHLDLRLSRRWRGGFTTGHFWKRFDVDNLRFATVDSLAGILETLGY